LGKVLGYGRISSGIGQDVASQKDALEKLGAIVVFTETRNGSSLEGRDQLEAAIRLLEPGDELLALHPDRPARDTADLLTIGKRVVEMGAILKIDDPKITFDGTDLMAEIMLTLFGMIGSVEKHFIKRLRIGRASVYRALAR
jgi:DNA invertase Pin-like site-specific DNA recombinase